MNYSNQHDKITKTRRETNAGLHIARSRSGAELLLGRSANGAGVSAAAALNAGIRVDHIL